MTAVKSMSRFRGQTNHYSLYPQPEGVLGDCMIKYGRELADSSLYGRLCVGIVRLFGLFVYHESFDLLVDD